MNLIITAPEELITPAQLIMRLPPDVARSADEFFEFCQRNRDLRIERKANGEIIIMSPAGGETGGRNATLNFFLARWTREDGRGIAFDSSTGFDLPNGATLSPDAAWVLRIRLAHLTPVPLLSTGPAANQNMCPVPTNSPATPNCPVLSLT